MKILITGSSGLIGTELKKELKARGHQIFTLVHRDNNPSTKKDLTWSIKNNYVSFGTENHFDVIVHLAGANISKPWSKEHKQRILESREKGTELLISALIQSGIRCKHFISTSAIGYYSDPSNGPLTEKSSWGTGFLSDVCKKWEAALTPLACENIPYSIVRVGLVLSKNGGVFPVSAKTRKWGIVPITGSPKNIWSWIHIQDLILLYSYLIEGILTPGIYNAVAPEATTQGHFARTLIVETHQAKQSYLPLTCCITVPRGVLKTVLGERSILALTSQQVTSEKLGLFEFRFPNIEHAIRDLIGE
jgi:uncharacterized protein